MQSSTLRRTTIATIAVVILLVIATSPFTTVLYVKRHATRIVRDTLPGLTASGLAHLNISEGFLETSLAIANTNQVDRTRYLAQIQEGSQQTDIQLKAYEASINDPRDRENFNQLVQRRLQFRETREKVLNLLRSGKDIEALRLYNREGLPRFQAYLEALNDVVQYNINEARTRGEHILELCNLLLTLQGALLVFFLIYAFFVPMVTVMERLSAKHIATDI